MIPTLRLLLFLLLGSLLVAGVALEPVLLWLALGYLAAVAALVVVDYLVTTRPGEVELERINDTKLSLPVGSSDFATPVGATGRMR